MAMMLLALSAAFVAPPIVQRPFILYGAHHPLLSAAADEEARIRIGLEGDKKDAATASFEESQVLGAKLASILSESCASGEPMPSEAVDVLRTLVSTSSGARGWFVTLLTDPAYDAVFKPPIDASLLAAIEASPDPNLKLLTMNVAMSTATELVHLQNGSDELAAASRLTRDRSKALLNALLPRMMGLAEEVQKLRTAVEPWKDGVPPESADKEWVQFTKKWKYGEEQRAAIKTELDALLAPFDGGVRYYKSPEIWAVVGYAGYALVAGADPVFCPEGPTSATALVVAKALTTVALAGWAGYLYQAAKAEAAKPAGVASDVGS